MNRAPAILFALMAVLGLIGVQAEKVTVGECTESAFDAPLERTKPTDYGLMMVFDDEKSAQASILAAYVDIDDSKSQKEEPKNVIVMNADESVEVTSVNVAIKEKDGRETPLDIDTVCRDSTKQLLVIKVAGNVEDKTRLNLLLTVQAQVRNDQRGVHRDGDLIKASFANSEARLSVPCFDHPKYQAKIQLNVAINPELQATSETTFVEKELVQFGRKVVKFVTTNPISWDELSFDLKPRGRK